MNPFVHEPHNRGEGTIGETLHIFLLIGKLLYVTEEQNIIIYN